MAFDGKQKKYVFLLFFLMLLILSIYMLRSYIGAILVGGLVAYFLFPWYNKILLVVKKRRLAQSILAIGSVLLLFVFLTAVIVPLISQTQSIYSKSGVYINEFLEGTANCKEGSLECSVISQVENYVGTEEFKLKSRELLQQASGFFFSKIKTIISSIASFALFLIIMVFSIFFFLENGRDFHQQVMEVLPLKESIKKRIMQRLEDTIKAVVGGNITVAFLQGFAAGMMFWILGIPAPLFWGLIITILAFIPAIGPTIIWLPTVILFFINGSIGRGIILLLFGVLVLGYLDNVLKPKLIGDKIKMSAFVIFLGVLGGLQMFGILGLFLGPLILALLVTSIQIYREMAA